MMDTTDKEKIRQAALPLWARILGITATICFFYSLFSDASIITSFTGLSRQAALWSFGLAYLVFGIWGWSRVRRFVSPKLKKQHAKSGFKIGIWMILSITLVVGLNILGLEIFGDTTENRRTAQALTNVGCTVVIFTGFAYIIWSTVRDVAKQNKS
ncbi:MAG: hypothetical protein GY761_04040 [Hyphomicrobiales bacterium]|nr:hypothetical protein [Hyphomicrobiales bacterium]